MYDVIIVGAGIVGCSIARELSRYNVDVLVLEKEDDISMGSTKANSAIVHGGYAESHSKLKGRLCYQGRREFDKLNKELNFGFSPIGSLVLAFSKDDLPKLEELLENGKKNGLEDLEIIGRDEILKMEPKVNPKVEYALHCKGAGVTSPYEMAIALMENAIDNGVCLHLEEQVISIKKEGELFSVETSKQRLYEAKVVINASGLEGEKVSKLIGLDDASIGFRSGQYILLNRGSGKLINKVLFQMPTKMGKGILVTPTYHGNLLIGPDALNDETKDLSTDVERLYKIFTQGCYSVADINPNLFLRSFAGVRAVSSTDDFIIEHSKIKGFIQCIGIQSPGITSSPAISKMVVEIIKDDLINLEEKEDFNPYRKPIIEKKELKPLKEIAHLVELEDGEDKIICRCEQVDKKTILDALSRGIRVTTVDGVKRRTRAGMGFCQGDFCRPRVTKVLQEYYNMPIDSKTDIEKEKVDRVGKKEFLEYLKSKKSI